MSLALLVLRWLSSAAAEPAAVTVGATSTPQVVVPSGRFQQGQEGLPDAPPRAVAISAFAIDRDEVSVEAFEVFVAAGGYADARWWSRDGWAWARAHPQGSGADLRAAGRASSHPVVAVTWYEADAYCRWRGGRLPTEAEWERAACGEGGRRWPWGDDERAGVAWYSEGKLGHVRDVHTRPVAEQEADLAGPFGLRHAAGNVWEWTADVYHRDGWGADPPGLDGVVVDPRGPAEGPWRTLRGGSYMNLPSYATCAHREPARPDRAAFTAGFRCAGAAP